MQREVRDIIENYQIYDYSAREFSASENVTIQNYQSI